MIITKYGKVIVTEDEVVITEFHFSGKSGKKTTEELARSILLQAIIRIVKELLRTG